MPSKIPEIPADFPALDLAMTAADYMLAERLVDRESHPAKMLNDVAPALGWLAWTLAAEPQLRRDVNRKRGHIVWPDLVPGTSIANLVPAMIVVARSIPATVSANWDGHAGRRRLQATPRSKVKDILRQADLSEFV